MPCGPQNIPSKKAGRTDRVDREDAIASDPAECQRRWSNYKTRGSATSSVHHPPASISSPFAVENSFHLTLEHAAAAPHSRERARAKWRATQGSPSSRSSCCPASSSSSRSSPPSPCQVSLGRSPPNPAAMAGAGLCSLDSFIFSVADFVRAFVASCGCRKPAPGEPAAAPAGCEACCFFSGTLRVGS